MDYNKVFDELRAIAKEHNVAIWTAQQPTRKFSGHSRLVNLSPHKGESRYIGFFPMDHIDLINE